MATVALFLVAVWLPLAAVSFLPAPKLSFTEKRFLARWPHLEATPASIASWPGGVEAWFDDRLGFRDWLIRNFAALHIGLFGVSPAELMIVGKEGWLFLGDADAVAHYRGLAPLNEDELERWRAVAVERRDWLADRGIAYLLVLVPDKHLIYGEYMPDSLPRTGETHPLDQLASHLRQASDVPVLDLREALLDAKRGHRVYHKTDSHWNDLGAYAAYRAIHERMRSLLPSLGDRAPAAVTRGERTGAGLGLASVVGLADRYEEEVMLADLIDPRASVDRGAGAPERPMGAAAEVLRAITYRQDDPTLPRALVFRDSFGDALIPYLAEDFSRSVFVWDRDVDPEVVLRERPDIVIHEIVGRFLGRRPRSIEEVHDRNERRAARRPGPA